VSIDGALIAPIAIEDSTSLSEPGRLVVQSVAPGSAAEALGIGPMDVIHSIDGKRFDDLEVLIAYMTQRSSGSPVRIVFRRMSQSFNRWFEYHVRELPGESTQIVGPDTQLLSSRR
jgi:S1-C subfamily serine protease